MNSEIDGTYTRLLCHALNINCRQHVTTEKLCGDLHKISSVIQQRLLRLAGHCYRSDEAAQTYYYGNQNMSDSKL